MLLTFYFCYTQRQTDGQTDTHIRTVPWKKLGSFLPLNNRLSFTEFSSYWSYSTVRTCFHFHEDSHAMWPSWGSSKMQVLKKIRLTILDFDWALCFSRRNFRDYMLIWRVLLLFQVHLSNSRHICDCLAELGPQHSALSSFARGTHGVCGRYHALFLQIKLLINCWTYCNSLIKLYF